MHLQRSANAAAGGCTEDRGCAARIKQAAAAASRYPAVDWAIAVFAIGLIGTFDYLTGIEIRTYPLYYVPISLLAWTTRPRENGRQGEPNHMRAVVGLPYGLDPTSIQFG